VAWNVAIGHVPRERLSPGLSVRLFLKENRTLPI
jgi:hypothetical protein